MKLVYILFFYSSLLLNAQSIEKYIPVYNYNSKGSLFDTDSLRKLNLTFYDTNYHKILLDSFTINPTYRLPAKLELNGQTIDSVGLRYKGNSTFLYNLTQIKKPLNIAVDFKDSNQNIMGYNKLKLANSWFDPTFVKEVIASKIYQKYLPTQESNLLKIYTSDNYLGLYVNAESINKKFLKKHFGESNGVFFKGETDSSADKQYKPDLKWNGPDSSQYFNSYTLKSEYGWDELVNLIDILNNNTDSLHTVLNIDRVLWYFAVNMVIANFDTYNGLYIHNYYLYKTKDELFQIIPWDLSESFIGALMRPYYENRINEIYNFDPYFGQGISKKNKPLVSKILDNPFYHKLYTAHLRTVLSESLDTNIIKIEINKLHNLINDAVLSDENKNFSNKEFSENINRIVFNKDNAVAGILSTIKPRKEYLLSHPDISKTPPNITELNILIENENKHILTAEISNANKAELLATNSIYNSNFFVFPMNDEGIGADKIADDGIYSTYRPFQEIPKKLKFYIRAENNDAIQLSPERAEYEFYTISPHASDLVFNEILAINNKTISDQNNEYDDWIELYNNTNEDIFLGNFYLSNNINELEKWKFPNIYIAANGYSIIWADKDTNQIGLHANFKLSGLKEIIYLVDSDSNIIDEIDFNNQFSDISYGRSPNGTGPFKQMTPSFAEYNNTGVANNIFNKSNFNKNKTILKTTPNPFKTEIKVKFKQHISGVTKIAILDQSGSQIKLLANKFYAKGEHYIIWDGSSYDNKNIESGIYFVTIKRNDMFESKKIILLK